MNYYIPVDGVSESAEMVDAGGEETPSHAAVDPASEGVVLRPCNQPKEK